MHCLFSTFETVFSLHREFEFFYVFLRIGISKFANFNQPLLRQLAKRKPEIAVVFQSKSVFSVNFLVVHLPHVSKKPAIKLIGYKFTLHLSLFNLESQNNALRN
jgi:hypothetical protein